MLSMLWGSYIFFQIISFYIWGWGYFSYLSLVGAILFGFIISIINGNKIYSYFIFPILLLVLFYSFFSFFLKNPNNIDGIFEASGNYIIYEKKIRNRASGEMNPKSNYLEPVSSDGLYLKAKNSENYIEISCSITESGCPFSNNVGDEVFVKYKENILFDRNFAFYIKYGNEIYDEDYFYEKYRKERQLKVYFIFFYIFLSLVFVVFWWVVKYKSNIYFK